MQGVSFEQLKFDKYRDKTIKFYDKGTYYDLIFCGDFDQVNKELPVYSDLLYDLKQADKEKQIHVWIHSCGGSVSTLMALSQQLEEFEYVVTIGLGQIDSAGFMLWCFGDEKYLSPSTFCMFHAMSSGYGGKTDEIKEYGQFLKKYQDVLLEKVQGILTPEQIERGKYTQIWILGRDLIDKGVAINYSKYKSRQVPMPLASYKIGGDVYIRTNQGLYDKIISVQKSISRKKIMLECVQEDKIHEEFVKSKQKIGEQFTQFFKMFLDSKFKAVKKGEFISDCYLLQSWKHFSDSKFSIDELKDKFEEWIELFGQNLFFEKNIFQGKKKGFIIKTTEEEY